MAETFDAVSTMFSKGGGGGSSQGASAMSQGASALSVMMSMAGAAADGASMRQEAILEDYKASEEQIQGRNRAIELNDALVDRIAQNRVALAAGNIRLGGGLDAQFTGDALTRGDRALAANERAFTVSALTRRNQAKQLRSAARTSETMAFWSGAFKLAGSAAGG